MSEYFAAGRVHVDLLVELLLFDDLVELLQCLVGDIEARVCHVARLAD